MTLAPNPPPAKPAAQNPWYCSLGHANPPGSAFCDTCGEPLTPPAQDQSICSNCGYANLAGSAFCDRCASPLIAPAQNQPPVLQPEPIMEDDELQDLLSSTQLPTNTILRGRYRIVKRLGKGGMGAVYQAKDTTFNDRFVAVKQMLQIGLAPQMLTIYTNNFKREANMLAELMHHSLPRIYDYFSEGECWYLVMDYIKGVTLQKYLEQAGGRLPVEEALRIGVELCTVLGYLHSRQPSIIFRDLKPANVMIASDGHLYLIDFGIAREYKPDQTKDTHHFVSAGYAAPEQYGHGQTQTTSQSDIYSLGATLHQMLSGHNPSDTPFDFAPLQVGIPELTTLVQQMLQIRPSNRPGSVDAVRQTLQRILTQVQSGAKPALSPSPQQPYRPPEQITLSPWGAFGYLHMLEGKEPGRVYELRKDEIVIGRARESDIFLEDLAVGRLQAKVVKQSNLICAIRDEGSPNGTKVNGQVLAKFVNHPLQEGDKIQLGHTIFLFSRSNKIASKPEPPKAPALGRLAILRIEKGTEMGRVYELRKDTFTIGRSRESDMFLEDLAVSRLHASVVSLGNGYYAIKDEGSANGTKLNWQPMNKYQTYPLQEGDRIQPGNTVIVFGYK